MFQKGPLGHTSLQITNRPIDQLQISNRPISIFIKIQPKSGE